MTTTKKKNSGLASILDSVPTAKGQDTRIEGNKDFVGKLTFGKKLVRNVEANGKEYGVLPCYLTIADGTRIWIDLSFIEGNDWSVGNFRDLFAFLVDLAGTKRTLTGQFRLVGLTSGSKLSQWREDYAGKAEACGAKLGDHLAVFAGKNANEWARYIRVEDIG